MRVTKNKKHNEETKMFNAIRTTVSKKSNGRFDLVKQDRGNGTYRYYLHDILRNELHLIPHPGAAEEFLSNQ